jgi:hypothetical protein
MLLDEKGHTVDLFESIDCIPQANMNMLGYNNEMQTDVIRQTF